VASEPASPSDAPGRTDPDFREPAAIFIGSEGAGLPHEVLHSADATISIPMRSTVESLNAGIAASIVLFDAARQRRREK
jgi:TrmH family RNA methyltransferase